MKQRMIGSYNSILSFIDEYSDLGPEHMGFAMIMIASHMLFDFAPNMSEATLAIKQAIEAGKSKHDDDKERADDNTR